MSNEFLLIVYRNKDNKPAIRELTESSISDEHTEDNETEENKIVVEVARKTGCENGKIVVFYYNGTYLHPVGFTIDMQIFECIAFERISESTDDIKKLYDILCADVIPQTKSN